LFKVFLNNKILSVHTYFKVDFANWSLHFNNFEIILI
jgi:hypothetical protein